MVTCDCCTSRVLCVAVLRVTRCAIFHGTTKLFDKRFPSYAPEWNIAANIPANISKAANIAANTLVCVFMWCHHRDVMLFIIKVSEVCDYFIIYTEDVCRCEAHFIWEQQLPTQSHVNKFPVIEHDNRVVLRYRLGRLV